MKHDGAADPKDDALERLRVYSDLLVERALPLGFVSRSDGDRMFERHVMDSARAAACLWTETRSVVDVGSGAGLPGIPVAILRPDISVCLIEPLKRRAAFLEFVAERLALSNVLVAGRRAEESGVRADAALARALAPAVASWKLSEPLLKAGGGLIYFAGRRWSAADMAQLESMGVVVTVCETATEASGALVMMRRAKDSTGEGGERGDARAIS